MAKPVLKRDPLSQRARSVISLFSEALPDVRFPDVDLKSLEMAADELRALQLEVERIEAELEEARLRVSAQSEVLNTQAERGLAYARIFAANDLRLSERVAEVGDEGGLTTPSGTVKKRARSKKSQDDATLFAEMNSEGEPQLASLA